MIVADTGAIVALLDRSDRHHKTIRSIFEARPERWILPWAILPEVDYMLGTHVGPKAQSAFVDDLADDAFNIAWGDERDIDTARRISDRYRSLNMGLVDAVVIATAIRHRAEAIATLDLRHFSAVAIPGQPKLLPRDL